MSAVFDELRQLAHRQLAHEHDRFTLQTSDLVQEAYLRLSGDPNVATQGRVYFYAAAGRAIRQVLVDAARRRNTVKRGDGEALLSLDGQVGAVDAFGHELLDPCPCGVNVRWTTGWANVSVAGRMLLS